MKPSPLLALAAALLVGGLADTACAQSAPQWKWRDARGQVQYSDLPPPKGTPDADILQRPRPTPAVAAAAASAAAASAAMAGSEPPVAGASAPEAGASGAVDPELEARRKQAEQADAARRQAEEANAAKLRSVNCDKARNYLRMLESGERMSRYNDKGEKEFIDDTQRARESAEARRAVSVNCR